MKVKRAAKYGFCSGVRVADIKVRRFASENRSGAILGQVVHNERVVSEMEAMGMRTVHVAPEAEPVDHIHYHTDDLTRFLARLTD